MFHLSCRHADKINLLPYRIPLAKNIYRLHSIMVMVPVRAVRKGGTNRMIRDGQGGTFQCVYGAAGDVSNPVLV